MRTYYTEQNERLYRPQEVAEIIGKTNATIRLWYKAESENSGLGLELPDYENGGLYAINNRNFYTAKGVEMLQNYNENIKYGSLAKFYEKRWTYKTSNPRKHMHRKDDETEIYNEILNSIETNK